MRIADYGPCGTVRLTRRVGDRPPADPGELKSLVLSTRTHAVAEFTGPDGGQTAHYMLQWLSTRGLPAAGMRSGPFSP